jgi:hypothetical protein
VAPAIAVPALKFIPLVTITSLYTVNFMLIIVKTQQRYTFASASALTIVFPTE